MLDKEVAKEEGRKQSAMIILGFVAVFVFLILYTLTHEASSTPSYLEDACHNCDYQN